MPLLAATPSAKRCVLTSWFSPSPPTLREDYRPSRSGAIPLRWTAIEVLTNARAARKYSTKTDVWAFGILWHEILADGEKPYVDMTNDVVIARVSGGYRLPQHAVCPDNDYEVMLRCWHAEPLQRPSFTDILAHFKAETLGCEEGNGSRQPVSETRLNGQAAPTGHAGMLSPAHRGVVADEPAAMETASLQLAGATVGEDGYVVGAPQPAPYPAAASRATIGSDGYVVDAGPPCDPGKLGKPAAAAGVDSDGYLLPVNEPGRDPSGVRGSVGNDYYTGNPRVAGLHVSGNAAGTDYHLADASDGEEGPTGHPTVTPGQAGSSVYHLATEPAASPGDAHA